MYLRIKKTILSLVAVLAFCSLGVDIAPAQTVCTSVNAVAAPPVVSGMPQVGVTLSTTTGSWTGNPSSFAYQWYGNGTAISGATASTYIPVTGDIGHILQAGVIAVNAGGTSCASQSAATTAVLAAPGIANISAPIITGTAQVGQTLTASTGTWSITSGTTYTYQWNRSGTAISAATSSTYVPVTADVGNMLTVTVVATNGSSNASATSAATAAVSAVTPASITIGWTPATTPTFGQTIGSGFLNAAGGVSSGGAVLSQSATINSISAYFTTVSGNFEVGIYDNSGTGGTPGALKARTPSHAVAAGWNTINVTTPVVLNAGTYWFVIAADNNTAALGNGTGTAGHTYVGGQTYALPATAPAFPNAATPAMALYATLSTTGSASIPANTAVPTITGTPQVGQTLAASNGTWTNSPTSYTYQWNSSASGTISAATTSTYVPVVSDIGNALTASVIAKNATGASIPATSLPTSSVIAAGIGPGSTTPRTASLLCILGISGHVGNYADNSHTVADAAYLNIGKWRDGISGLSAGTKTIYQGLVNEGIQIIGLPWNLTDNTITGNVTGAESVAAMGPGALFAIEGPNEPSISTFIFNGFNSATTWQGVSQWQSGLYSAVRADSKLNGVPVLTPSLVGAEPDNWGLQYLTTASGTLAATGLQYADGYNFHIYPLLDGIPSAQWIDPVQGDHFVNHENADFVSTYAHSFAGSSLSFVQSKLRIITETNLQTVPAPSAGGATVDKPTQGKDILNGFMNAWNEGFSAFCIYTFYPFSGDGTEIFSGPGAPYAPATYIHNFTTALLDTGATAGTFPTSLLNYTLGGLPSTAKALVFQKSTGAFEIVIWNNVTNWNKAAGTPIAVAPTTVTVNFPAAHGTLNAYDPTSGTAPIATASSANAMSVSLKDYPVIVEVLN